MYSISLYVHPYCMCTPHYGAWRSAAAYITSCSAERVGMSSAS